MTYDEIGEHLEKWNKKMREDISVERLNKEVGPGFEESEEWDDCLVWFRLIPIIPRKDHPYLIIGQAILHADNSDGWIAEIIDDDHMAFVRTKNLKSSTEAIAELKRLTTKMRDTFLEGFSSLGCD